MLEAPTQITHEDLATEAIALIRQAGCEYGEIRLCRYRDRSLTAHDRSLSNLSDRVSSGFGIRVLHQGSWGFAASHRRSSAEVSRIVALAVEIAKGSHLTQQTPVKLVPVEAYRDNYRTPIEIDPFTIPIEEQAELLLEINERLLGYGDRGIKKASSFLRFTQEEKTFASTEGSLITQTIYRS
ncbi:MAG TPA: DNA gyrase modulator, partial [Vampirovibrionales bacterium]